MSDREFLVEANIQDVLKYIITEKQMCENIDVRFDMGKMIYITGDTHGGFK